MNHKPDTKQPDVETQKNKATIIVAWIGSVGLIVAAVIAALAQMYPVLLNQTPIPQPTVYASETPALLPISDSETTATFVPATFTALPAFFQAIPVPIGEDWMRGCISTLWQVYPPSIIPIERGDGCWREPLHAFSAENGDLDFFFERRGGSPEVYGLFTELPESGSVTFTVRLRDLYNVDLWMGVYDSPDLNSQGMLMTILNGPVEKRPIIQKDPHSYATLQGSVALAQGNGYSITFTFDSLYVSNRVNPAIFVVNPVSIPSSKKWLFLGYKGLNGSYRIDGTFLSFELKP